jgi:hypothetical protein
MLANDKLSILFCPTVYQHWHLLAVRRLEIEPPAEVHHPSVVVVVVVAPAVVVASAVIVAAVVVAAVVVRIDVFVFIVGAG